MSTSVSNFVALNLDFVRKWDPIDFSGIPNVIIGDQNVFKTKAELRKIYSQHVRNEIKVFRKARQIELKSENSADTVPQFTIVTKWTPKNNNPNLFKFNVILNKKKGPGGKPEDTKSPTSPKQVPAPIGT